jgi:hypothetical protein
VWVFRSPASAPQCNYSICTELSNVFCFCRSECARGEKKGCGCDLESGPLRATSVLCLADGKDELVAEYHGNVQKLALFIIEMADNVDLTSNEGGEYWKALYVFRKHATEADDDVDARVKTR